MEAKKSVLEIRYGDDVVYDAVKGRLSEWGGIDFDSYIDFFGIPDKYKEMKIDPSWFSPALPGMENETDVVTTMAQAENLLEDKKIEAFKADLANDARWDGYELKLTEEEAEEYMKDPGNIYLFEDEGQFAYDDLLADIETLLGDQIKWRVEGQNLTWTGSCGYMEMEFHKPEDVMKLFSSYGQYSLTIRQVEGEQKFSVTCRHHDCPVNGSYFEFIPIKEKKDG